jgi:hypothetical protein
MTFVPLQANPLPMERLHFSTSINATRERIWQVLWEEATYPQWTKPFGAGGRAVSDWKQGSRVLFLSAEGDGMFGVLKRVDAPAFMGIEHLGVYKDGHEQPADALSREWSGAKEEYTLTEGPGGTQLAVSVDVSDGEVASFRKMFPEALALVKQLAER